MISSRRRPRASSATSIRQSPRKQLRGLSASINPRVLVRMGVVVPSIILPLALYRWRRKTPLKEWI